MNYLLFLNMQHKQTYSLVTFYWKKVIKFGRAQWLAGQTRSTFLLVTTYLPKNHEIDFNKIDLSLLAYFPYEKVYKMCATLK